MTQRDETNEMQEALSAWIDGELSGEEEQGVRAALEGSAALREELEALESVDAALRDLAAPPLPEGLIERIEARIAEGDTPASEREAAESNWRWPIAALIAAAVLGFWLATPRDEEPEQVVKHTAPPAETPANAPEVVAPEAIPDTVHAAVPENTPEAIPEVPLEVANDEPDSTRAEPEIQASDVELAIAFELETLRDLEVIEELDLLEALLVLEEEGGSGGGTS